MCAKEMCTPSVFRNVCEREVYVICRMMHAEERPLAYRRVYLCVCRKKVKVKGGVCPCPFNSNNLEYKLVFNTAIIITITRHTHQTIKPRCNI